MALKEEVHAETKSDGRRRRAMKPSYHGVSKIDLDEEDNLLGR